MLNFEKTLTIKPKSTPVSQTFLIEEPNAVLYNYYNSNHRVLDEHTDPAIDLANYDNMQWTAVEQHLTTAKVERLGVKAFPGIGAYAYWKLLGEERSKLLIPVHNNKTKFAAPSFTFTQDGTSIKFKIQQPVDDKGNVVVTYECFRIVFRYGLFAHEFITYDTECEIIQPYTGTYDLYIIGYVGEGLTQSLDSEPQVITIEGVPYPVDPITNTDIYASKVVIDEDGYIQVTLSNGTQVKSDNLIPIGDINTVLDTISGEVV